jgi:hypothetical protein
MNFSTRALLRAGGRVLCVVLACGAPAVLLNFRPSSRCWHMLSKWRRYKFVANSVDRSKISWMSRIFFEFLPQSRDVIVYRSVT